MSVGYWFIGWSKEKQFWTVVIVIALLLFIFVSLNIGTGKIKEVNGIVSVVSLDTSKRFELPTPMITAVLGNGNTVTVEGIRGITVKPDDEIILFESKRLFTSGAEYKFKSVNK